MEPVRIGDATLYTGDVLSVLATLPDESVHCVVTSPPYWGLRDYGTGTWEGGEPGCDHKRESVKNRGDDFRKRGEENGYNPGSNFANYGDRNATASDFERVCGKCGARRIDQQIGLEETPEQYVAKMVAVFREVRRVLRKDGTCWVNLGDSKRTYGVGMGAPVTPGCKAKDLVGIPWMVAFALRADGWYLRSDIIWAKPNPMPESVTDRPTKAHEYLFLLSKSPRYFYDAEAVREPHVDPERGKGEPEKNNWSVDGKRGSHETVRLYNPAGRNRRTVWTIATEPYPEAHFATFPRKLVQPCILAGCPEHACPKCGAPWEREVEHVAGEHNAQASAYQRQKSAGVQNGGTETTTIGSAMQGFNRTIGEHPICACGLAPIGGTVLDPFGGSGTTAEVALEYGRRAILIELKPEYVELAKRRLRPVAGRPLLDFAQ